jgi:hypothetical protein
LSLFKFFLKWLSVLTAITIVNISIDIYHTIGWMLGIPFDMVLYGWGYILLDMQGDLK